MKRIIQGHTNGCFAACIAMLLGCSYIEAVRLVHPYRSTGSHLGVSDREIKVALKRAGLKSKAKKRDLYNLDRLEHNAIIIIDHPLYAPALHAVIWDRERQKILDPYPRQGRRPNRHLPLKSYQNTIISITEICLD